MVTTAPTERVTDELIADYQRRGVAHVRGLLTPDEVQRYLEVSDRFRVQRNDSNEGVQYRTRIFDQFVNVWQQDEVLRELTLLPRLHQIAAQLAGIPVRLWHDHMLVKAPHNEAPTEFHQDAPYWPHSTCRHSLSAWIALVDVPAERGCMTFLPGSQRMTQLRPQDLANERDMFIVAPELVYAERVTLPLRAGDCTFHNSFTAHMATPNHTDEARYAHVVAFMDAETTFSGASHVVTAPLGLAAGDRLDGPTFPRLGALP